ncbi:hypothetical protein [Paenibacillus taichungensis]
MLKYYQRHPFVVIIIAATDMALFEIIKQHFQHADPSVSLLVLFMCMYVIRIFALAYGIAAAVFLFRRRKEQ